jgi:hypothetical protein
MASPTSIWIFFFRGASSVTQTSFFSIKLLICCRYTSRLRTKTVSESVSCLRSHPSRRG